MHLPEDGPMRTQRADFWLALPHPGSQSPLTNIRYVSIIIRPVYLLLHLLYEAF